MAPYRLGSLALVFSLLLGSPAYAGPLHGPAEKGKTRSVKLWADPEDGSRPGRPAPAADSSGVAAADVEAQVVEVGDPAGAEPFATVLCRFGDSTGVTPKPASYFTGLMANVSPGLDHYFREVSYNNLNLAGSTVAGWFNLPQPRAFYLNGDGSFNTDLAAGDCSALADPTVNFVNFTGINFVFNDTLDGSAYGGTWVGTLEGVSREFWATWLPPATFANQAQVAHQMGHAFGFSESRGPVNDHDSQWDLMSAGGTCSSPDPTYGCIAVHPIAFFKVFGPWIPLTQVFVAAPGTSPTVTIDPVSQAAAPAAGHYRLAVATIAGEDAIYTFEARSLTGYDARVPAAAVVIHRLDFETGEAIVMDSDGNGNPNDGGARWLAGETFSDPSTGLTVTINSQVNGQWSITISRARQGGAIGGTVTNAVGGTAIPSVEIGVRDTFGVEIGFSLTGPTGQYVVDGLPNGSFYVFTEDTPNRIDELYNNIPCPNRNCTLTSGTPVVVSGGGLTSGINFALALGGSIAGTVSASGVGVPNAIVHIFDSQLNQVAEVMTAANGTYVTDSNLPTGSYRAVAVTHLDYVDQLYNGLACPKFFCNISSGTAISVTAGAQTGNINFAFVAAGTISGTVTSAASGLGIQSVEVNVYNSFGTLMDTTLTDHAGAYFLRGLPSGSYFAATHNDLGFLDLLYNNLLCALGCTITSGTSIAVTAPSATTGINFNLAVGGGFTGNITNAANAAALSDVQVKVYINAGGTPVQVRTVQTNGSGTYTVDGLPAGTYFATTSNQSGFIDELYNNIICAFGCTITNGTGIVVVAATTTNDIDFALAAGGTITGTVTGAADGSPLLNIGIALFAGAQQSVRFVNTDDSGVYSFTGLPTGSYTVRTFNQLNYQDELFDNISCALGCSVTSGTPISVTAGSVTGAINFALILGGSISGTITNASNAAPIFGNVLIFNSSGFQIANVQTDQSGTYKTGGLPAGIYHARTQTGIYVDELYNNIPCVAGLCTITSGAQITVIVGQTTGNINFALVQGGMVTGTVTNAANGNVLPNVQVLVVNNSNQTVRSANTNGQGNYTINGVPTGTYNIRTSNPGNLIDELYNNIPCPGGICSFAGSTTINVTNGGVTSNINFALSLGGIITGTITNAANSTPLQGVIGRVLDANGVRLKDATTNASGVYSIGGLPTGTYRVRTQNALGYLDEAYNNVACQPCNPVTQGAPVAVTAPATTSSINFALDKQPAATNDNCGSAINLTSFPFSQILDVHAATSGGDPTPSCGNQSRNFSVWYKFTAPEDGVLDIDTFGSNFNSLLSVYTGGCGAFVPFANGCNDDAGGGTNSALSLHVTSGTTLFIMVSSTGNTSGTLAFHSDFLPDDTPFLNSIPGGKLTIGASNTLSGKNFTAGTVIKLFVNTGASIDDVNPSGFTPTNVTPTSLTWNIPSNIPLGQGFGAVFVVNTDKGFTTSQTQYTLLQGSAASNIPTITSINGVPLASGLSAGVPVAHIDTVVLQGTQVTIGGTGFNNPGFNIFAADLANPGQIKNYGPIFPSGNSTSRVFTMPNVPFGPVNFQAVNSPYTGNVTSNSVSALAGNVLTITSVQVNGSTVTVLGTGFSSLSVINLYNKQGQNVVNLGGLNGATPKIPLTFINSTQFTFTRPAAAQAGPSYIEILNPPFIAFTSSGNDPDGAFTFP